MSALPFRQGSAHRLDQFERGDRLFQEGIAAGALPNVEMVAFTDLRMEDLAAARRNGTVQALRDRRFDLYSVAWTRKR